MWLTLNTCTVYMFGVYTLEICENYYYYGIFYIQINIKF